MSILLWINTGFYIYTALGGIDVKKFLFYIKVRELAPVNQEPPGFPNLHNIIPANIIKAKHIIKGISV